MRGRSYEPLADTVRRYVPALTRSILTTPSWTSVTQYWYAVISAALSCGCMSADCCCRIHTKSIMYLEVDSVRTQDGDDVRRPLGYLYSSGEGTARRAGNIPDHLVGQIKANQPTYIEILDRPYMGCDLIVELGIPRGVRVFFCIGQEILWTEKERMLVTGVIMNKSATRLALHSAHD